MSEGLSCSFVVVFVAAAVVEVAATEGLYFFAAAGEQVMLMLQHGGCPRGVSDDVNDVVHRLISFNCYTLYYYYVYMPLFQIFFVSLPPQTQTC